jgi:ATP-dependent DNA helicase RecG
MTKVLQTGIEFLKGVGPQKADLLKTELGIHTFEDLLGYFPFRHEDRTKFHKIREIQEEMPYVQLVGFISSVETTGEGRKKRLVAQLRDDTGTLELVWFQGVKWVQGTLKPGVAYVVFGKPARFGHKFSISHPDIELFIDDAELSGHLEPVYSSTEKLKKKFLDSKGIARLQKVLLPIVVHQIQETLPEVIIQAYGFPTRSEAVSQVHFPTDAKLLARAIGRMKFEELLYVQLQLLSLKNRRQQRFKGLFFPKTHLLTTFYKNHLPFDLTEAQKRVIREIFNDFRSGWQMNRLLQGDVGSGKTIVAFICMLLAIDNGAQACMMAPTEILTEQHFQGLKEFADTLNIPIACLTGSTRKKDKQTIIAQLKAGEIKIVVGTHALIEDTVDFQNLGLCVIDEQHRFGVAQRAKLWNKQSGAYPHILVMTATPIPRTLAMTLYGDLDVSVIDQMPAGRKPIKTSHRSESSRLRVFGFIREQITRGRQAYIVYPLIEESEKLDYLNLMDGYESITRAFPEYQVSILHGKMTPQAKEFEMQRFVKNETKIMVATTVIEVGVNVPNASVMVIENAERFGLAQLHQLRGRVGRGAEQSYCILITGNKLSKEGKFRMEMMVQTNNGFEIADADLKLRGPGDLAGTQQSGVTDLRFTDLARDSQIVNEARNKAKEILEEDPELTSPKYAALKMGLEQLARKKGSVWSRIS